jgi:NAD(P)-dependent dehydrogenase (short-subunit alcohol dehydrogenase family)
MSVQNKVALITGAASGIGRECALTLARQGAAVVVADLNSAASELVVAEIIKAGGRAISVVMDVTRGLIVPSQNLAASIFLCRTPAFKSFIRLKIFRTLTGKRSWRFMWMVLS